jgi:hypothetical protein
MRVVGYAAERCFGVLLDEFEIAVLLPDFDQWFL